MLATCPPNANHHDAPRTKIRFSKRLVGVRNRARNLQIDELQFVSAAVGDFQKILNARIEHESSHLDGSRSERADDARRAGSLELLDRLFLTGAGDDLQLVVQHVGREHDVEVVRVGLQNGCECFRPLDSGSEQCFVKGCIADYVVPPEPRARFFDPLLVDVDDNELLATFHQVLADRLAHAAVAADDRVALELSNLLVHPSPLKYLAETRADKHVSQLEGTESKNAQPGGEVTDDENLSLRRASAPVVRAHRRQRDDRLVEAVQPGCVRHRQKETDRADEREQKQQAD